MANRDQSWASLAIGNNAGNRLDYSNRQLRNDLPSSRREMMELMDRAYDPQTGGPGSKDYSDLMAIYQAGYDINSFPDADGGGVPRSAADTMRAAGIKAQQDFASFDLSRVDPLLVKLTDGNGTSLAALGPDAAKVLVMNAMADASSNAERQQLDMVDRAIMNSPVSTQGINIDYSFAQDMGGGQYSVSFADDTERDESGYTQMMRARTNHRVPDEKLSMADMYIKTNSSGHELSGVDMTTIGSGGGSYDSFYDLTSEGTTIANYQQGGDMHQGDSTNLI